MTASAHPYARPIVDVALSAETPPRLQQAMTQPWQRQIIDAHNPAREFSRHCHPNATEPRHCKKFDPNKRPTQSDAR